MASATPTATTAIDVNASGQAIAAFGEAPSWDGPGGIWVNSGS